MQSRQTGEDELLLCIHGDGCLLVNQLGDTKEAEVSKSLAVLPIYRFVCHTSDSFVESAAEAIIGQERRLNEDGVIGTANDELVHRLSKLGGQVPEGEERYQLKLDALRGGRSG